jgi:hypothetical protein
MSPQNGMVRYWHPKQQIEGTSTSKIDDTDDMNNIDPSILSRVRLMQQFREGA